MANNSDRMSWLALIVVLAATFAAAGISSQFAPSDRYRGLNKPFFDPPDAVFGPVWTGTVLDFLMAIAAWLVWRRRREVNVAPALAAYGVQLVLNADWSSLFYGRHQIGLALADIMLLWIAIVETAALLWHAT